MILKFEVYWHLFLFFALCFISCNKKETPFKTQYHYYLYGRFGIWGCELQRSFKAYKHLIWTRWPWLECDSITGMLLLRHVLQVDTPC